MAAPKNPLETLSLPIETPRLRLEPPSFRRVDEYRPLLNDPLVSRWLLRVPWPYHRSDAAAHIRRARRTRRDGTALALAIVDRAAGRLVGGIGLHNLDWHHRHGEVGYWVGRPFWGQGFGSEALSAVLRLSFDQLRLHRVDAAVFRGNSASEHLLLKMGFSAEGVRKEAFLKGGVWRDDLEFGLLRSDWRRPRSVRPRRASRS